MYKCRIVLAGGGTGGHVFPIQSMIVHLDKQYSNRIEKLVRYGSRFSLDYQVFQQTRTLCKNIPIIFVHSIAGKFRRETRIISQLKNIRDIFLFVIGILSAYIFLRRFRPDVIFCKGGFVALPLVIAASIQHIPLVVHESDTRAGMTNRIASWFARRIFTAFPNVLPKGEVVGQILSDAIIPSKRQSTHPIIQQVIQTYNPKKTYVAVIGGSQGSQRLYKLIVDILAYNKKIQQSYIFLIIGGFHKNNQSIIFRPNLPLYRLGFCSQEDMGHVLALVDMSITRAGTTSLAEQHLYNIKKIIVPISWTHDQYTNAEYYHVHYGDIVIDMKTTNYLETLDLVLQQHIGYKKKPIDRKQFDSIPKTKDIVAQALLQ